MFDTMVCAIVAHGHSKNADVKRKIGIALACRDDNDTFLRFMRIIESRAVNVAQFAASFPVSHSRAPRSAILSRLSTQSQFHAREQQLLIEKQTFAVVVP